MVHPAKGGTAVSESTPQTSPPDPFGPGHADSLVLLDRFHAHRAAGASLLESTCLVAAFLVAVFAADQGGSDG